MKAEKRKIWHIVVEGSNEQQMRALFEEIQNRYSLYDNCVLDEADEDSTIIDEDRREETGGIEILPLREKT